MRVRKNYFAIIFYATMIMSLPLFHYSTYLNDIKGDIEIDLKLVNYERNLIASELSLADFEIEDIKKEILNKKDILANIEHYEAIYGSKNVKKFSSAFEDLNNIFLDKMVRLLTMRYDSGKFTIEAIFNNRDDILAFRDYSVDIKRVLYKNNRYIILFDLTKRG